MVGEAGRSEYASSSRYPMTGSSDHERQGFQYQPFSQSQPFDTHFHREDQQQQHTQQHAYSHQAPDPYAFPQSSSYPMQSVANTGLAISPSSSSTFSPYARTQKRTRPRRRPPLSPPRGGRQSHSQPDRIEDDDDESDSDEEDDPSRHGYSMLPSVDHQSSSESPHKPPKKRMHLDQEDVGRFAEMSIFESGASSPRAPVVTRPRGRTLHRTQSSIPIQNQPRAPPASPAPSDRQRLDGLFGMTTIGQSVQLQAQDSVTPAEEWVEDAQMSADKPPNSWDVDRYTTYVHFLEDDEGEAGQDDDASAAHQKATIPITRQEAEELQTRRDAARTPTTSTSSSPYEINPELLAKLEAHSRSVLIGGDMSRRRSSVPTTEETKTALILWKGPEQLFEHATENDSAAMLPFAEVSRTSGPANASVSAPTPTPIFAFGSVESPSPTFSPSFAPRRDVSGPSSTAASSMSVTPLGSPRVTFTPGSGMEVDEGG